MRSKVLKPSFDGKVAFYGGQKNSYGLLPGPKGTCPGATTKKGGCNHIPEGRKLPDCYVYHIMSAYSGVRNVLTENTRVIKDKNTRLSALMDEFARFHAKEMRRAKRKNIEPSLYYRLHWAGDFFSQDYVNDCITAMNAFPDIQFWAYTRSFEYVQQLSTKTRNLSLYISCDPVNIGAGLDTFFRWQKSNPPTDNVRICYMSRTNDFADRYSHAFFERAASAFGSEWPAPDDGPKLWPCPVDIGKLATKFGCSICQNCVHAKPTLTSSGKSFIRGGLRHVWFRS